MIKYSLGLVAFAFITGCAKADEKRIDIQVNQNKVQLSKSELQIQNARYENDAQKDALSGFITGTEFCEKYKEITSKENGFYVQVPVDYQNLSRGTTNIWAFFTSGPFDASKPTVMYFDGGSGGNSHGNQKALKNYNELRYDQRGIGCSHPDSLDLYRSPDFYSNENNARDADEVRKHLGIKKLSLIGGSYGTVVATVYASVFSENTTAVILDGTVYDNEDDSSNIGFYLKKMYVTLPEPTKLGMKKYFKKQTDVTSLWSLARLAMYSNKPMDLVKNLLMKAFPSEHQINMDMANRLFNPSLFKDAFFGDSVGAIESFNNRVLNCKNIPQKGTMPLFLYGPTSTDGFYDLQKFDYPIDRTKMCDAINVRHEHQTPYAAKLYPIKVPVTYFQGNMDSATPISEAMRHYKTVPLNQKQIFIARGGGHCPALTELNEQIDEFIEVIESALAGKKITPEQLVRVKKASSAKVKIDWVYTEKNWNP